MSCSTDRCPGKVIAKGMCRSCYYRQYMREYRKRKTAIAYKKKWGRENSERVKAQNRARYRKDREKYLSRGLMQRLKEHGMTLADYEDLLAKQKGQCAICFSLPSPRKRLCVDHCHKTGKVRGLLCDACNKALGLFRDDPHRLKTAQKYLRG